MNYRRYAIGILLLGAGVTVATMLASPERWTGYNSTLLVCAAALIALTRVFPLKISPQAEASLAGAPVFLAALLLEPSQAGMAGAAGSMLADARLHRKPIVLGFNAGVTALAACLSSLVFHYFVPSTGSGPASTGSLLAISALLAAVAAGIVLHTVNLGCMVGMLSLRKGMSFWTLWRRIWVMDAVQEGGVIILGFLAAVLTQETWWAPVLLGVPLLLAYFALRSSVKYAGENVQLAKQLKEQMQQLYDAQAQLVQSAKMASVGTLAAGVAHEINNPLFVISGKAELLLHHKDMHLQSEKAQRYVRDIYDQSQRAAQIVRDLLAYSRTNTPVEPVEVSRPMDLAEHLIGKELAESGVVIKKEYQVVPSVQGRENLLSQVFINLLQNSRDAMPSGGTITLKTWTHEGRVRASVRDQGPGVPAEQAPHIFEPFYTTKEVGKGTGLGLYICHRVIEQHNGRIWVETPAEGGAEIIIELPALDAERHAASGRIIEQALA